MICQYCETTNSPLDFACISCGQPLESEEQQVAEKHSSNKSSSFSAIISSGLSQLETVLEAKSELQSETDSYSNLETAQTVYESSEETDNGNNRKSPTCETVGSENQLNNKSDYSIDPSYQIQEQIGEGAMGIVFRAMDIQLSRQVAIKVFRNKKISQNQKNKMLKEARLASSLNHPNVVTVYDVSRDSEDSFIAMEWIEGKTLDQYLPPLITGDQRNEPSNVKNFEDSLSLKKKVGIARQIASGLACAHDAGIIHRDLKPSNIMIRKREPLVKILDFGIAEISSSFLEKTIENKAVTKRKKISLRGTLCYMSPEQSRNETLSVSSDIFSFGIILYEMFYGVHPFLRSKPEQTIAAIQSSSPKQSDASNSPFKHKSTIPKAIHKLIKQCLNKKLALRPDSMKAVQQILVKVEKQEEDRINHKGWRYWFTPFRLVSAILLVLLTVFIGPKILDYQISSKRESVLLQGKTVAILPFDNMSGDPALDIFSQGLSISLSNQLAMVGQETKGSWVVPATELRKLKNRSVEAVYKKYNPELVITGSLQHQGNIRRLSISILNAKDSKLLHSIVHDIPINEVFKWQGKIRESILAVLDWPVSEKLAARLEIPLTGANGAYEHYLQGLAYLYRYDYKDNLDKSIEAFTKAVEVDEEFVEAIRELARAYVRASKVRNTGNWNQKAEFYGDKVLKLMPSDSESYRLIGDILYAKSEYELALIKYEKSLELNDKNAMALFGMASIYKRKGEFDNAEASYLKSLDVRDDWTVWNYLAIFYYKTNQYEKAVNAYSKLQKLSPNNEFFFQISGALELSQRNYKSATKIFTNAVKISPNSNNFTNLGSALFYDHQYEKSIEMFLKATKLSPDDYLLFHNLGDGYKWYDNRERALEAYSKALELLENKIKLAPKKRIYRINRALLYAKLGNKEKAVKELKLIEEINDSYHLVLAAQVYVLTEDYMNSINLINKAIAQGYHIESLKDELELKPLFKTKWKDLIKHY